MSREEVCSMLDGNAAGGLLREVFAFGATVARTTCAGYAKMVPMGELRLYAIELGAILALPIMRSGCHTNCPHVTRALARPAGRGNSRSGVLGRILDLDPAVQPANASACGEPTLLAGSESFETV
jgi:hypothetical protein